MNRWGRATRVHPSRVKKPLDEVGQGAGSQPGTTEHTGLRVTGQAEALGFLSHQDSLYLPPQALRQTEATAIEASCGGQGPEN